MPGRPSSWGFGARSLLTVLLFGACESSTANQPSEADASAVDTGPRLDDLFTSPDVPRCENTFTAQYQLKGSLDGQETSEGNGFISYLDSTSLSFGAVRLTWAEPLAEDTAIPLTGTSLAIPPGHPLEGHGLCITQGKFGSPTVREGDAGRQFLFEVTGARLDDCAGRDVPIHVHGCLIRTSTYFPVSVPKDAGVADVPSASDAGDSRTAEDAASKADAIRDSGGIVADAPSDGPAVGADGSALDGRDAVGAVDGPGADGSAPSPLGNGLVSWWRCEGNASDSQGGNHGTPQGGITFVEGEQGQACQFNGTDGTVTVKSSSTLDVDRGFTLAFLVRFDDIPSTVVVILRKLLAGYEDKFVTITPDGTVGFYLFNVMNGVTVYTTGSFAVVAWYHIALVYDGTRARVYVDGALDGELPASGSVSNRTGPLVFGQSLDFPYFAGALDEIRWYARSLGAAEITSLAAGDS